MKSPRPIVITNLVTGFLVRGDFIYPKNSNYGDCSMSINPITYQLVLEFCKAQTKPSFYTDEGCITYNFVLMERWSISVRPVCWLEIHCIVKFYDDRIEAAWHFWSIENKEEPVQITEFPVTSWAEFQKHLTAIHQSNQI